MHKLMHKLIQSARPGLYILAGTLILMLPAIYNGYPLIYSDSSTYIASGFSLQPPLDRPITYGLFIRLASLNGLTLWTVIFLQSFLLTWLLYQIVKRINRSGQEVPALQFAGIILVSALAGAAWATSFLLPDIFTPMMLLSALLLLLKPPGESRSVGLWIIFGLSAAMHSSHIPIGVVLMGLILAIRFLLPGSALSQIRIRIPVILLGVTLAAILFMGSSLSKSKHVFQMGAYIEQGIIGVYLQQECDAQDYSLCAFKDSLPEQAWEFIWEESSPLYKLGGWKATKEEFNQIIRATWTKPRYLVLHLRASFRATILQLLSFQSVFTYGVSPNLTLLRSRVDQYIPGDLDGFDGSRQNRGPLNDFAWLNPVQLILVILALALIPLLYLFVPAFRTLQNLLLTGIILAMGILTHAWVCGTFANPVDRLGNRMIWLLPFYAMVLIFRDDSKFMKSCLKSLKSIGCSFKL